MQSPTCVGEDFRRQALYAQRSRNTIEQLRGIAVGRIGMAYLHGSHRGIVEHARKKLGRPARTRTGGRVKRNHLYRTPYTESTGGRERDAV